MSKQKSTYWTRSRFAQWAQTNALKPEIPTKLEREYGSVDNMELWGCPDFLYGNTYRIPLPDGWCDHCKGEPLPRNYRKWRIKVWVPKHTRS